MASDLKKFKEQIDKYLESADPVGTKISRLSQKLKKETALKEQAKKKSDEIRELTAKRDSEIQQRKFIDGLVSDIQQELQGINSSLKTELSALKDAQEAIAETSQKNLETRFSRFDILDKFIEKLDSLKESLGGLGTIFSNKSDEQKEAAKTSFDKGLSTIERLITHLESVQKSIDVIPTALDKLDKTVKVETAKNKPRDSVKVSNLKELKEVSVGNLEELGTILESILTALSELPAPIVEVQPPKVTVKPPDVKVPEVKIPPFPKSIIISSSADTKKIIAALTKVEVALDQIPKSFPEIKIPKPPGVVNIGNFSDMVIPVSQYRGPYKDADGYPKKVSAVDRGSVSAGTVQVVDAEGAQVTDFSGTAHRSTTPAIYNVTMTDADTEYSQVLPDGTDRFSLQCQDNYDVRFAFATGKVATPTAPYGTVKAGTNYYEEGLNLTSVTIYFACGSASQVAEIIAWT